MSEQEEAVHLLDKLLTGLVQTFPENRPIFVAHQEWLARIATYQPDHPMLIMHLRELAAEVKAWSDTAYVLGKARVG